MGSTFFGKCLGIRLTDNPDHDVIYPFVIASISVEGSELKHATDKYCVCMIAFAE